MSDVTVVQPQPVAAPAQPKRKLLVSTKVRQAIDLMIWQGLTRQAAADQAGLKDNSLYVALAKPDVKTHYLRQLEVLRTSERARNIHALAEVRESDNQMARVAAVKALEQLSDETPAGSRGSVALPGLTIQILNAPAVMPHERVIEAKPLITKDDVRE